MKRWLLLSIPFVLTAVLITLTLPPAGRAQPQTAVAAFGVSEIDLERALDKMDATLAEQLLNAAPDAALPVILHVSGTADLQTVRQMQTQAERGSHTYNTLRQTAVAKQAAIRRTLDAEIANGRLDTYHPFFIINGIALTAPPALLIELTLRHDVTAVTPDSTLTLHQLPMSNEQLARRNAPFIIHNSQFTIHNHLTANPQPLAPSSAEWNIAQIHADDVWQQYAITGQGVLVAGIDSGVQYNHPALVNQYAGNLGNGSFDHSFHWYDATTDGAQAAPYDDHGHGTHTLGTVIGGDGLGAFPDDIGVAPGAKWIAIRIFDNSGTAVVSTMLEAFEWLIAPCPAGVQPGAPSCDPSRAPQVVNNSWGINNGADETLRAGVQNVLAAGIWLEFSAGNSGPGAATLGAPGSFPEVFTTGATDDSDVIADFSSRGPSPLTSDIKPDVVAPGVNVRSAVPGNRYQAFNGTSMAGPHSVGVAALMLSADPTLDFATMERLIRETAVDLGDPGSDMVYGYGRIDAFKAVQRVVEAAALRGQVTNATGGAPLAGVTVRLEGAGLDITTLTDASGNYEFPYLIGGSYTLSASRYGYESGSIANVAVPSGAQVVQNVALTPLPTFTISGQVSHAITPSIKIANALISVRDTPLPPVQTDANGNYSIQIPQGTAVVEAAAFGYQTDVATVNVNQNRTVNFSLQPLPPILLVDDDEGDGRIYSPHVQTDYLNALDTNGYSYDYWDIEADGSPDFATIRQYNAVIWFGGEWGRIKDISDAPQAQALMAYLDLGGNLFYVSQSHTAYFGDDKSCDTPRWGGEGPCPFTETYLGLAGWVEDQKAQVAYGVSGNPVGDGFGPLELEYPPFVADLTDDITPTIKASLAFTVTDTNPPGDINRIAVTVADGFKTVYMAAPFGAFPATDRADIMKAVLEWFGVSGQTAGVTLAPSQQTGIDLPGTAVFYKVRLRNLNSTRTRFALNVINAQWPTTIWNADFTQQIDQVGSLEPQAGSDIGIRVQIPAGTKPGAERLSVVQARALGNTPFTDEVQILTKAQMRYYAADSDTCGSSVHFNWVNGIFGDPILLDDNNTAYPTYQRVALPRPFTFYNNSYDHLYISDHGTVLFGDDNFYTDRFASGTPPIPNPTLLDPNNAIYLNWGIGFWHPPDQPPGAGVYTHYDTSNGRHRFIITYYEYGNFIPDTFDNMQVILDLDDSSVLMQYKDVSYTDTTVVGIENFDGTDGILYVNDLQPASNLLHDGLAIHYGVGQPPPVLEIELDPATAAQVVNQSGYADYVVTLYNNGSLDDSYTLEAVNNHWPVTFYDVDFNSPIDRLADVDSCTAVQFGVRVQKPANGGLLDSVTVRARSQRDSLAVGTAVFTSRAHEGILFLPVVKNSGD